MKSTVTWINRFETWRKVRGIANELENIKVNDLDSILQSFFAEIRKGDGTEYEPECLRVILLQWTVTQGRKDESIAS